MASRTLGAGPARTFFRVVLPLASGGLAAGAALSLARGLGEFGATIMFAGSLQGVTQTLPLAIYHEFDVNLNVALAIAALFVIIDRGDPAVAQTEAPVAVLSVSVRATATPFPPRARARGRRRRRAGRPVGRRASRRCSR